jgi:hypothetical protein
MQHYLDGHQAVNDNPRSPPSGSPLETGLSCAPSGGPSFGRRSFGEFNQGCRNHTFLGRGNAPAFETRF